MFSSLVKENFVSGNKIYLIDEYIRQLTHDNVLFEKQWSKTLNQLIKFMNDLREYHNKSLTLKQKALNAIVNYVLAEQPSQAEPIQIKFELVETIIKQCCDDPRPSLEFIVRHLLRIFEINNIFDRWHLMCIQTFYYQFKLGEWLLLKPSIELIELLFRSLQRHSFFNDTTDEQVQLQWGKFLSEHLFSKFSDNNNRLNEEEVMLTMRNSVQQLLRHAIRKSHQSSVWSKVVSTLSLTLPTIFDNYDDGITSQIDLLECVMPPISSEYIDLLSESYKRNVELFKMNASQVLTVIENFLLLNHIEEAKKFVVRIILVHFNTAVNINDLLNMFNRVCLTVKVNCHNELCKEIIRPLSYKMQALNCNTDLAHLFFDFIIILLDMCVTEVPVCVWNILNKNEFYPWQELSLSVKDLVRLCAKYDTIDQKYDSNDLDKLEDILRLIVEKAKIYPKLLNDTHDAALQTIFRWSKSMNNNDEKTLCHLHVYKMGCIMLDLIDEQQVNIDACIRLITAVQQRITIYEQSSNEWNKHVIIENFFVCLTQHLSIFIRTCKMLSHEVHNQLALLCFSAINRPLNDENDRVTFEYNIISILWTSICQSLTNENDVNLYEKFLKQIHLLAVENNKHGLFELWDIFWNSIGTKMINITVNYVSEFLIDIIDQKQFGQVKLLPMLYLKRPQPFHNRIDQLIKAFFNTDTSYIIVLTQLLWIVAKLQPELITPAQVDRLFASTKYHTIAKSELAMLFEVLAVITNARPHLFYNYYDVLVHFINEQQNKFIFDCLQEYFVASTIIGGEQTAHDSITMLIDCIKHDIETTKDIRLQLVDTCQLIGLVHKPALECKREDLLTYSSYPECRMLLDFIDGKYRNHNKEISINRIQEQVTQIERRLFNAKRTIQDIEKTYMSEETTFDYLDIFVYGKTDTSMPSNWNDDIIRLLNDGSQNDWNRICKHLGYSVDELKHWTSQTNPAMALLKELFITHNKKEVIYGLVKILDDIGRQDVTKLIREASLASGNIIPNVLHVQIKRLPSIFLSYCYDSNPKIVSTLKYRLEKAGYACWMKNDNQNNIQMFINRDSAIQGAKIFICCMSTYYLQADECLHEMQLIVNTEKPLLILNIDNQPWHFESAFNGVVKRCHYSLLNMSESSADDDFLADKFAEILGRIRYYITPNVDMISEQYKNWFVPHIDNLIFLQPLANGGRNYKTLLKDNITLVTNQAQIVFSYEWDSQVDIILLYKRLTQIGFRCWIDIFQMNDGESLTEKIKFAIRDAKCVFACITRKYLKSINGQREMLLAERFAKPIVPLLLEHTSRWPPIGSMSLILAQTTYFDFCSSNKNLDNSIDSIECDEEFEKLLVYLANIIPDVKPKPTRRRTIDISGSMKSSDIIENKKQFIRVRSAPIIPKSRACCMM